MTPSQFTGKPWHSRRSPLARAACATYALLLLYAGLAPWSGWRDLGLNPFAYLAAPIPAHVTNFDLVVNVLAYLPFGALLVFALHPAKRGLTAVLIALSLGLLLAAFIEAAQSFLQTRIPSNLDLSDQHGGRRVGSADRSTLRFEPDRSRPIGRLAAALVRTRRIAVAAADRGLARCADLSGADVVRQRQYP